MATATDYTDAFAPGGFDDPTIQSEPTAKPKPKGKAKKGTKEKVANLTPAEVEDANAQGMTPAEYAAAYPKNPESDQYLGEHPSGPSTPDNAQTRASEDSPDIAHGYDLHKLIDPAGLANGTAFGLGFNGGTTNAPKKPAAKAAPPSAAEQLMDSLAGQYQKAMGVVDPYINGSVGTTATAAATAAGASMGGPTQPPPAAAAGIDNALTADAQAYQKANDAGAAGLTSALKDTGLADKEYLQVSPYVGLLTALQNETTYKQELAAQGGSGISLPKNSPAWLTQAYINEAKGVPSATGGAQAVGAQPATSSSTTPSSSTPDTTSGA